MDKETDEQRIKRLEGTVDALKFNLENLAKQLLLLEVQFTNSDEVNEDIHHLVKDTTITLHTIQTLYPCRRKRNQ
jgi:hypothetical protein